LAIALSLLAACGCAVHRVRADFTGFEKAYADTSNRELLLNLARLQNHDPTYFFKMGQITSSYRMSATVPTSVGYASQSSVSGKSNTTGGATPGLSYESDPLFQFIPVNDETNAQLLLKQIPAETFYILYQQGWRIDQLFRLMVDRIEVTMPAGGNAVNGCNVAIYRNVPPTLDPITPDNHGDLDQLEDQELSSYAGFLRASAIAYSLQRHGNLALREISKFVPLDTNAVSAAPSSPSGGGSGAQSSAGHNPANTQIVADGVVISLNPEAESGAAPADSQKGLVSATDIEKAAEKGLSYELYGTSSPKSTGSSANGTTPAVTPGTPATPAATSGTSNGKILIGQRLTSAKFYITPAPPLPNSTAVGMLGVLYNLMKDSNLSGLADEVLVKIPGSPTLKTLTPEDLSQKTNMCQTSGTPNTGPGPKDISQTAFCIFLGAVQNGFAIEDDPSRPNPNGGPCPILSRDDAEDTTQQVTARLVLRSLIGVMAAAAQEQALFDGLKARNPQFHYLQEESSGVGFRDAVPDSELLPVLRINWKPDYPDAPDLRPMPDLIQLNYRETDYRVADPFPYPGLVTENQYWNRDVFRLIAALTAQVTVDTSKYPIANILQLNAVQ